MQEPKCLGLKKCQLEEMSPYRCERIVAPGVGGREMDWKFGGLCSTFSFRMTTIDSKIQNRF